MPAELRHVHIDTKKLTKNLDPKKLEKLVSQVDLKDALRKIGNAAEQIEARSEEVRTLSGQAKRLSRRLS